MCYEATRDLPLEEVEIETPITMAKTKVLAGRKLALVGAQKAFSWRSRSSHLPLNLLYENAFVAACGRAKHSIFRFRENQRFSSAVSLSMRR